VRDHLERHPVALVVGFNKLPGLDIYYAADPCFAEKAREQRGRWYPWTARYRYFAAAERAVLDPAAATRVLVLTERQQAAFQRCYGTPGARFTRVPPPVAPERRRPVDADAVRAAFRAEFGLGAEHRALLALGSGFATKGLDRSIRALAALPAELARTVRLFVVGEDDARAYLRLARHLGVADRIEFFGGRADAQRFLLGCDLLLHPAYSESGGIVLLEAMIAGLPVIATGACGFAPYVAEADAGVVLPEPFEQRALDRVLAAALGDAAARARWQANGMAFGLRPDLYGMAERVADLIEGCL
jgi:UDP-glucose:(heptosyl)LPS alpha-1,3-glucosyltransferase